MQYAKAYVALAGSIATALLGVYAADTPVGQVLTVVSVVATAFATWRVPNGSGSGTEFANEVRQQTEQTRQAIKHINRSRDELADIKRRLDALPEAVAGTINAAAKQGKRDA